MSRLFVRFVATIGVLGFASMACMAVGFFWDQNAVSNFGFWLSVFVIGLSFLPLIGFVITWTNEKVRSRFST
jgi:uncharacterized membrane protein YedE/YeeE